MATLTELTPADINDWAVYKDDTSNEYHVYLGTEMFLRDCFNELVRDNPDDFNGGTEEEFNRYCLNDGTNWAQHCLDYINVEYDNGVDFKGVVEQDHYYIIQGK